MATTLSPGLTSADALLRPRMQPFLASRPQPPPLSPALTCLSLSIGEDLTADPRHAGNGVGNDWSRGEGAQDLGLSPEGGSTDLWVEEEPCSEAKGQERPERGKRAETFER